MIRGLMLTLAFALSATTLSGAEELALRSRLLLTRVLPSAATTNACADGTVLDDSSFESGFRLPFSSQTTFLQKFTPTSYPALLSTSCSCFAADLDYAGTSMSYSVLVFDDKGVGGIPGSLLGSIPAVASAITLAGSFFQVDCTPINIQIASGSVYIGAQWNSNTNLGRFLCADESPSTPLAVMYESANGAAPWNLVQGDFATARALGIRATFTAGSNCAADATTLCLGGGRFQVQLTWKFPDGTSGAGKAVYLPANPDSGIFYFNNAGDLQMLVKVLNACPINNNFWVFYAATTNVQFTLTVTDTQSGKVKTYGNAQGHPATPIQDTSAFPTCP